MTKTLRVQSVWASYIHSILTYSKDLTFPMTTLSTLSPTDLATHLTSLLPPSTPFTFAHNETKGIHVIATRRITTHEIVLEEDATITISIPDTIPPHIQALSTKLKCAPTLLITLAQLLQLSEERKQQLYTFWKATSGPVYDLVHTVTIDDIKQLLPETSNVKYDDTFLSTVRTYLLAHNANNIDNYHNTTAMYRFLSRFSHSCAPNATHILKYEHDILSNNPYPPSSRHIRQLRTLDVIEAGQEIVISYLSPQDLVRSIPWRHGKLQALWQFV